MAEKDLVEAIARAICKSKTCSGARCCEWPANMGKRHNCPVAKGYYDDAARAALQAIEEQGCIIVTKPDVLQKRTEERFREILEEQDKRPRLRPAD